jgi:hypothetical protein
MEPVIPEDNKSSPASVTIGYFNSTTSAAQTQTNFPVGSQVRHDSISLFRLIIALLITLLGPGAGHLYLKIKKRGWIIMGVTTAYLVFSLGHITSLLMKSLEVQKKILATGDSSEIPAAVQKFYIHFLEENSGILSLYVWLGTILFVGSLVDIIYLYV